MIRECGARFHEDGQWKRCVLALGHDRRHQDRLDTVDEIQRRGTRQ